MGDDSQSTPGASRRDVLRAAGLGALTWGLGAGPARCGRRERACACRAARRRGLTGPYNILFILTDQERFFRPGELPVGYSLPAHERLKKHGTTFVNHRINSCVCTPSRSVVYTGQHIQQTGMFDNTNFPWIKSMSPEIRTIGDMLRDAGYYTAYKGKWHLTKEFETVNKLDAPTRIFTKEMEAYGFSDYFGIGDIIAHTQGGYLHDGVISRDGRELAARQGSRARGRRQALVPRRESGEPARRDVLRHRRTGTAAADASRADACRTRARRSAVREKLAIRSSGESLPAARCTRSACRASRFPALARRDGRSRFRTRKRAGAGGTTTT